ncbi:MAG TPA: LysR substrate-binding domain-containing protein [Candidatus Saccharimonadales bacterium]|nr:LysR substrate-binding domain-containing protein [Candidatus Saccharimonadales bacterium]
MIIRNYEYLLALAQERHFGRAAGVCHVSQPTLSAGIKQLEEDMGVLIVKRGQHLEGFTAEGEVVLCWARQMKEDCRRLRAEIQSLKQEVTGVLHVGIVADTATLISPISLAFGERYPNVRLTIQTYAQDKLPQVLSERTIDLALAQISEAVPPRVRTFPLFQERYVAVLSSLGAQHRSVKAADMMTLPLCLLADSPLPGDLAALPRSGQVMETNSLAVLRDHLMSGQWSSVLPESVARMLEDSGLRSVPFCQPGYFRTVGFLVPPDAKRARPEYRVQCFMEVAHCEGVVERLCSAVSGAR